jgi:predicted acetyltransferase
MVDIVLVKREEKEILRNLLEKYAYEFSQYTLMDVNDLGLYGYDWLDCYWTDKNRFPYFIKVDGKLTGFVMVNNYPEVPNTKVDFCISEFFVMHKYRKQGVGKAAAFKVFDLHHGSWQLKRHPKNKASVYFWDKVIKEYTNNQFELILGYDNSIDNYEDGTPGDIFFFKN